jgi:flagellar hook-associated protein 3 FlgL
MPTRIGSAYNLLVAKTNLARNRAAYSKALEPISSGQRINSLSDDPAHLATYFQNTSQLQRLDQYKLNITNAKTKIDITDATLNDVGDLLNEAYSIAIQGNDQTSSDQEIQYLASRLTDIKEDIRKLGNTKIGNNYVFAGFKTTTEPFNGTPVVYNGDSNLSYIQVSASRQVQTSVDPDEVFMGGGTGVDIFQTLDSLITALGNRDENATGTLISDVQKATDQISNARGALGNAGKSINTAENTLGNLEVQYTERISAIADTDLAKATADLSFQEYTIQASMEVTKRVFSIQLQSLLS